MSDSERPAFESTVSGDVGDTSGKEPEIVAQRYKLIREIGRGGMGIVYLAHDERLNRYVALKWLLETARSNLVQRRFLREARTIASLGHIHIVQVYDISKDGTRYFISMEYVPGPAATQGPGPEGQNLPAPSITLDQYVKVNGPMQPEAVRLLIEKLCKALDYAHQSGIIHRDIKPANILLDPDLEPKLVDFGLARPIESTHSQEITQEGAVLGTPDYAAPEQMRDATSTDERVDVYSLAGVMWFALSGEVPRYFRESGVPEALRPIVSKALEKDRDERYPSAREFYHALHNVSSSSSGRTVTSPSDHGGAAGTESSAGLWICQNCMNHNADTAEYCVHCGTYGLVDCPVCQHGFRSGIQFCPKCGLDTATARQTISVLGTAKQQAEFCEFEAAILTLREAGAETLDRSDLGKMVKGWHQKVLERRNLMTEFEQAMHVYNLAKATELITELHQIMPLNCMMDSADYDCTIAFLEMRDKYRSQVEDAIIKAREEHNFARFSEHVGHLTEVFGDEECKAVKEELEQITKKLENAVTQAGLDLGVNCLSHAKSYLEAVPAWRGGDLGDHRTRLEKTCLDSLAERDRSLDEAVEHVRRERYVEALGALSAGAKYCINMNKKDIRPAPQDKQATPHG
jgi:tRNA A-37 threonylcarbamoyl transferase component Bud32